MEGNSFGNAMSENVVKLTHPCDCVIYNIVGRICRYKLFRNVIQISVLLGLESAEIICQSFIDYTLCCMHAYI